MKTWLKENWIFVLWSMIPIGLIISGIVFGNLIIIIFSGILFALGYFKHNYNNPLAKPWIRIMGKIVLLLWILSLILRAIIL